MRVIRGKDYKDMSRKAANVISAMVIMKPDCTLGLATGSTPVGIYEQLIDWYRKDDLDFAQVKTVNLDEYRGLSKDDTQSYSYFMHDHLFDHINIPPENIEIPDGLAADVKQECQRYNQVLQDMGGADLQLLGIGHNGHIGFNEPNAAFEKETHCVNLTESTIKANQHFFEKEEDVPRQAYTMGIKAIMQAKTILLVVSGSDKADILKTAFLGPVTSAVPASILQLHNQVILVADEPALSKIGDLL